jgi:hypothetical protein
VGDGDGGGDDVDANVVDGVDNDDDDDEGVLRAPIRGMVLLGVGRGNGGAM